MAVFRFPPHPQQPTPRVIQDAGAAVDDPPFGQRLRVLAGLALVVATWQPSPVLPQLQNKVAVSLPPVSEDNPAFSQRNVLPDILRAWQPASPTPQRNRPLPAALIAVPEDNPAPIHASRLAETAALLAAIWQPPPPTAWKERWSTRLLPAIVTAVPEDSPPFAHAGRNPLIGILAQWQPDYRPQNQQGSHVPVTLSAVSEDNPPFSQRRALSTILRTWESAPPLPVRGGRFQQDAGAVVADTPPLGVSAPILDIILQAWQPAPPTTWKERWSTRILPVSIIAVPEDQPPFGVNSSLSIILRAWVPKLDASISRVSFIQTVIDVADNPPFAHYGRSTLTAVILAQWQPAFSASWKERWSTRLLPVVATAVSEDSPPPYRNLSNVIVLRAWQGITLPTPQSRTVPQVAIANDPPFLHPGRNALLEILDRWQPAPPTTWKERWSTRLLPGVVTAVPEDQPPPYSVARMMANALLQWREISLPVYVRSASPQEGLAVFQPGVTAAWVIADEGTAWYIAGDDEDTWTLIAEVFTWRL